MGILNLNSTLPLIQALHCRTDDIIKEPNSTEVNICRELTNVCSLAAEFRFTPSEQTAIHEKLLEIKKLSSSQPNSMETNAVLLSQLVLILSQSEVGDNPSPLLAYTREIASAQKYLNFTNICATLRHLSRVPSSEDTQLIFKTLFSCLVKNRENQQIIAPEEASTAFLGLRNADFSDSTIQNIVNELIWHVNQNAQDKEWFYAAELAQSFFGLGKLRFNTIAENALLAFLPHVRYLTQTEDWFDGKQLEMITGMIKNISVDNSAIVAILGEVTQHIHGNIARKNWFESNWIEAILQNLDHLKKHTSGFLTLTALFPHIQHADKEYPLTFTGMELILSILGTPSGISFAEHTLPALLGHLELLYIEKSEEDFRNWLDHVLSPFDQYPTQSETIFTFRKKALAISEPENSKEDSLFDDPNSDSPRTLTTGSDASLTEEEAHHDTPPHSIHSDSNSHVNIERPTTPQIIKTQ